jgi:mono/diheme cytochrome c family protein
MRRVLKWIGIILSGLVGLIIVALVGVFIISNTQINKTYDVQPAAVAIPTDPAAIAEGKRLYTTRGCVDCHGADSSGKIVADDPLLGRLVASNLTVGQGGVGSTYSDIDWVRAIRHGLGPDGQPLLLMPSDEFNALDDTDLGTLIAYLKSVPAVDNEVPARRVGPLGRVLIVAGQIPSLLPAKFIDHDAPRPATVARAVTPEYGAYLAKSCIGCHGSGLSGGPIPGVPAEPPFPANLTPDADTGLGQWQEVDFIRAMREGKRPNGSEINAKAMPWPIFSQMTDTELSALWLYLQSIPTQPHGNR